MNFETHPQGAQTWIKHHANNTMPAFSLRSRSPDGAATNCGDDIFAPYYMYSFIDPERMKG